MRFKNEILFRLESIFSLLEALKWSFWLFEVLQALVNHLIKLTILSKTFNSILIGLFVNEILCSHLLCIIICCDSLRSEQNRPKIARFVKSFSAMMVYFKISIGLKMHTECKFCKFLSKQNNKITVFNHFLEKFSL